MPTEEVMTQLLNEKPDSLAFILEEEIDPNFPTKEEYYNYIWWLTKTHNQQRRSLVNDSMIQDVLKYHKAINSPLLFDTYLLATKQSEAVKNYPQQEELMKGALEVAKMKNDTLMIYEICIKLRNQDKKDKDNIKSLVQIVKQYSPHDWSTEYYSTLLSLYTTADQQDSIIKYAPKAIEKAIQENKPRQEFLLTRVYTASLSELGQSPKALTVLRGIEHKYPIGKGIVGNEIKLDYIRTWIALNEYDSAQVYIDYFNPILEQIKKLDSSFYTEAYLIETVLDLFQVVLNMKQGGTFSFNKLQSIDQLLSVIRENQKAEKEILLAQNKLERDKLNLEIEKSNLQEDLLLSLIVIMFIIGIIIFIYQRKLLQKERNYQKIKEELHSKTIQITDNEKIILQNELLIDTLQSQVGESDEIKQELEQLMSENEKMKKRNIDLQSDVYTYSTSLSKKDKDLVALEDLSIQNAKLTNRDHFLTTQLIKRTEILHRLSTNPKYIEPQQWVEVCNTIDQLFDNFSVRLHIDYSTLTEEDLHYCCLLKMRLSNSIISSLMGISPSSVTKRKQRIKEKINQHLSTVDIETSLEIYLWNYN